ncbi:hypothetical protein MPL3356_20118 [Mesorhizobium plurifarium]|uniref:Uncharacterized protein n=1 Tax=Mesorhizobium plurifarium TaxID=69974 RepID=A0A090DP05_MESPL|nr:hypothetical protein MPL3356_20118 [Mesorhizobium plurifarium]
MTSRRVHFAELNCVGSADVEQALPPAARSRQRIAKKRKSFRLLRQLRQSMRPLGK